MEPEGRGVGSRRRRGGGVRETGETNAGKDGVDRSRRGDDVCGVEPAGKRHSGGVETAGRGSGDASGFDGRAVRKGDGGDGGNPEGGRLLCAAGEQLSDGAIAVDGEGHELRDGGGGGEGGWRRAAAERCGGGAGGGGRGRP